MMRASGENLQADPSALETILPAVPTVWMVRQKGTLEKGWPIQTLGWMRQMALL